MLNTWLFVRAEEGDPESDIFYTQTVDALSTSLQRQLTLLPNGNSNVITYVFRFLKQCYHPNRNNCTFSECFGRIFAIVVLKLIECLNSKP